MKVSTKQAELGIGQAAIAAYRFRMVDYLPSMYTHEWVMLSRKPALTVLYYSIISPFDAHVWMFTLSAMVAEFVILVASQNAWSRATGKANPRDYIFEGDQNTGLFERMGARFSVF